MEHPSLGINVRHHPTNLVIPNSDLREFMFFKVNAVGYKIKNIASYQITWLVWGSLLSTSVFQFISSRRPQRCRNKKDAGREKTVRKAASVTTGSTVDPVKNKIIL